MCVRCLQLLVMVRRLMMQSFRVCGRSVLIMVHGALVVYLAVRRKFAFPYLP